MIAANFGLLLTAVAWGSMIPLINILVGTWDPIFLSALRYLLGAPILLLLLWLFERGPLWPAGVAAWRVWLLGAVGIGLFAPLYTFGIANSNPFTAAVLSAAGPIIAAGVAWAAFRIPLERGMIPAVVMAVVGGVLATYDPSQAGNPFDLRGGEPLLILASICWTWYSLAAQRWLKGHSQLRITSITMLTGAIVSAAIYLAAAALNLAELPPPPPHGLRDVGLVTWMVLVSVVAGIFLWNYGVRVMGIVFAALFMNLVPVMAILMIAATGVEPTTMQLLGAGLVMGGVLQAQLRRLLSQRRNRSRAIASIGDV